jgi:glycosyltransferase involved in cell wall biosynthesis
MRKVFCFLDQQAHMKGSLQSFLEMLDANGDEIYLYTDLDDKINDPGNILSEIDRELDRENENVSLVFMSNMEKLLLIFYRLYHQLFHQFIYYRESGVNEYRLYDIYQEVFSLPVSESEMIYKPIYANVPRLQLNKKECEIIDYADLLNDNAAEVTKRSRTVRKYYCVEDIFYLFEPVLSEEKLVISLPDTGEGSESFLYPGYGNMQYMYDSEVQILGRLFDCIDNLNGDTMLEAYQLLEMLEKRLEGDTFLTYQMSCCILDDAAQLDDMSAILRSIFLLSFLMQITGKPHYLNTFLKNTIENIYFNSANRFFIWNQCKRYSLDNKTVGDVHTEGLMKKLYLTALDGYQKELAGKLTPIPNGERDTDTILVFTHQFLSERHAPTRTTLERCYTLGKLLNKKIVLFNTREQYTRTGAIILYKPSFGKVMDEYNEISEYQYKDYKIPFYQSDVNMPNISEIEQILEAVRRLKPSFILSIANGSIVADLVGKVIPQAAIGLAFSTLPTSSATFSIIGRKLSDTEWSQRLKDGYTRDSIIETTFTFELNPKKSTFTRKDFHIPENCFLLVTIGIRLDSEITDDFVESIQKTFPWGTHIVFAGEFSRYEDYCSRYPEFRAHSTFIGYCNDILALMEICDLYINPRRLGGGFSVIEAFHEGKPGISIRYGDVATAAGEDFCVGDYHEMEQQIKRYMADEAFYNEMSEKARLREKVVTDSVTAMKNMIEKIQNNRLFH